MIEVDLVLFHSNINLVHMKFLTSISYLVAFAFFGTAGLVNAQLQGSTLGNLTASGQPQANTINVANGEVSPTCEFENFTLQEALTYVRQNDPALFRAARNLLRSGQTDAEVHQFLLIALCFDTEEQTQ